MLLARGIALAVLVGSLLESAAFGQNLLVSRNSNGDQADADIYQVVMSDDGTRFAFATYADNLGEGSDDNNRQDIFYRDLATGRTIRISQNSLGRDANQDSRNAAISGDGGSVVFETAASNILPNDANNASDVLLYDVATATLEDVSVRTNGVHGNGGSVAPAISYDGSMVAFMSYATNLVPNDTNGLTDVFLRDRIAGTTQRVSVAADGSESDGNSSGVSISADGRFVCFDSNAGNLVPGIYNGYANIYVKDVTTGAIELENFAYDGSKPFGGDSGAARISADGSTVVFVSEASNLAPGDVPHTREIYVRDRTTGTTELASVGPTGAFPDAECMNPCVSGDGRFVYFVSTATNLVDGTGGTWQIFVRDRVLGVTMLAVYNRDEQMVQDGLTYPAVSPDATHLAFISGDQDLTFDDTLPYSVDAFMRTQSVDPATSSNYGSGWPGSNGVPWFVATPPPALGQTITLAAASSLGRWSVGLLFGGAQPADLPTGFGGNLELIPTFVVALAIPPEGVSFSGAVPADERLVDASFYAQVLEQDPGASDGVSFTPGLQLTFGF